MYWLIINTFREAQAEEVKTSWTQLTAGKELVKTDASAKTRVLCEAFVI